MVSQGEEEQEPEPGSSVPMLKSQSSTDDDQVLEASSVPVSVPVLQTSTSTDVPILLQSQSSTADEQVLEASSSSSSVPVLQTSTSTDEKVVLQTSTFTDGKVLVYNEFVIRRSDIKLLEDDCFLTDNIIGFYLSYLSASFDLDDDILLLPPSVSFWLANCDVDFSTVEDSTEALKFRSRKIIVFPVNDVGGIHWSLLVYHRQSNCFIHHDSFRGLNKPSARDLFNKVKSFVTCEEVFKKNKLPIQAKPWIPNNYFFPYSSGEGLAGEASDTAKEDEVEELSIHKWVPMPWHWNKKRKLDPSVPDLLLGVKTPQQTNKYDCGIYIMAIAKAICQWHTDTGEPKDKFWFATMNNNVNASIESTMRAELVRLIENLAEDDRQSREVT